VNADPASAHPRTAYGGARIHGDATGARAEKRVRRLITTSKTPAANHEEASAEVERLKAVTEIAEAYVRAAASCLRGTRCTRAEKDEMGSQLNAALNALTSMTQEHSAGGPFFAQGWQPGDTFRRWSRWWCILTAVVAIGAFAAGTMVG
jgi:hypothetical protein